MRSEARTNTRNRYRRREWDTRAGTIELAIPKLRTGSYFPEWLLERRRRAEAALVSVVATSYLLGVSTRRMEKLVETLGTTRLSKSQVSVMAKDVDVQVEAFRTRPLDAGPYTFVTADAPVLKVREGGRTVNVHALLATGVNADGYREILGLHVTSAEDGAGWLAFFRDLVARGLTGVALVTSDAHRGLVEAIGAKLAGASWQRCRTHYAANLVSATPKSAWGWVKALLHSIYDQPDAEAVHAQVDRVLDTLGDRDAPLHRPRRPSQDPAPARPRQRHRRHRSGGDPSRHHRIESNPRSRRAVFTHHAAGRDRNRRSAAGPKPYRPDQLHTRPPRESGSGLRVPGSTARRSRPPARSG